MKSDVWIEFQELHGQVHCDDGTMPEKEGLEKFYKLTVDAFGGLGMHFHHARDLGHYLGVAGFKNVRCRIFKIPIGHWPNDDKMRSVGMFMASAVADAIPAFVGKPFEAHGISAQDGKAWQTLAMQALADNSKHRYFNFYFWYAQKP
ncbi:putative methyltransferase tdiE [Colletotrichum spaethianum]|uniref:Methyltransferase tdiE n=1 Tax=Colletotrichum spaethianum TaxID=700344 RepID=A0AA37NYZ5_9PEZI|nr:putative methyltransferase tdiE [Colletotrichum spaethianum]GKT41648.1 putative methyltransferase tdiE [Colletotrichum spaethianum]